MSPISDIFKCFSGKTYIENYIGNIDVERSDGTLLKDVQLWRKEELADADDIESTCGFEFIAYVEHDDEMDEEIFLGDCSGNNIKIKENVL